MRYEISGLLNLKEILEETPLSMIMALDTEGTSTSITQASIVDAEEKEMMNRFIKKGAFKPGVIQNFISLFNKVKILVGYNILSDIKALAKKGVYVPASVIVVDVYETFMQLLKNKEVEPPPEGNTLASVAKFYGFDGVCGYHNSMVDATITMRLFIAMNKHTDGKFVVLKPEILSGKPTEEEEKKEEKQEMQNPNEYMNYDNEQEPVIIPVSKNLYECAVTMYGKKVIVRLTKKEFKLYKRIREMTPNYPVWVFYRTVVAPGVLQRLNAHKEEEPAPFCEVPVNEEKTEEKEEIEAGIIPEALN